MAERFAAWRNPVFERFRRSRLRLRKSIFWYLLTIIVTTFLVTMVYILRTNDGTPGQEAARSLWLPLLIVQGVILLIKGTGSVAAGFIQDKVDQTLDYQRLTPMTPLQNLLGYLFGLPVLEYAMFVLTLPHLLFIVVMGKIALSIVASVYLVFFVCALLYHATGIAIGLVMKRWIYGYLFSVLTVALLNIVLPTFISQFGLKFLQYLSMWPVIGQKLVPLMVPETMLAAVRADNPFFSMADSVPFFGWTLSPFLFTLVLQSALLATFVTMALRRWRSLARHSLSKGYALGVLGAFVVLFLGNLWPAITGRYMPFAVFGVRDLAQLREAVAVGLPLVYCLAVWLLGLILFMIVTPTHHAYVRGIRRARKLGRARSRPWDDDSAVLPMLVAFTLIALSGYATLLSQIAASGFFDFVAVPSRLWLLPVAFVLALVYTGLLLQVIEIRPTVLAILLIWLVPVLVAAVSSAALQGASTLQAVLAALSPLALVVMAALLVLEGAVPVDAGNEFSVVLAGVHAGLAFIAIQIAVLAWRWQWLGRAYRRSSAGAPET